MRTRDESENLRENRQMDGKKQRMMTKPPIGMIQFSWVEANDANDDSNWKQEEIRLVKSFNQEDTVPENIPFFVVTACPDRKYPRARILHGYAENLVDLREELCMSLYMRIACYIDNERIKEQVENIKENGNGEPVKSPSAIYWECVQNEVFGDYSTDNPLWKYSIFWKGQWIVLDGGWDIKNKIFLVDSNIYIDLVHDECRLSRALRGLELEACAMSIKG